VLYFDVFSLGGEPCIPKAVRFGIGCGSDIIISKFIKKEKECRAKIRVN
jgi:hypothetical protein